MNSINKDKDGREYEKLNQYVTFSIGRGTYGIDTGKVREIVGMTEIVEVPNTLPFMKGVIDLRGIVVPLIDIRIRFNMDVVDYNKNTVIIIVEIEDRLNGIIVDSVSDVMEMSLADIQNTPQFSEDIERKAVSGIGKKGDELIVILNVDSILSVEEMKTIDEVIGV